MLRVDLRKSRVSKSRLCSSYPGSNNLGHEYSTLSILNANSAINIRRHNATRAPGGLGGRETNQEGNI